MPRSAHSWLIRVVVVSGLGLLVGAAALHPALRSLATGTAPATVDVPRLLAVDAVAVEAVSGYRIRRELVGRVEAVRTADVGFERAGRVVAVGAREGDSLEAGHVVARLDTARLEARRRELEAARREAVTRRELATATLERTREAYEFDGVTGQQLDEARERLEAAQASVEAARARIASVEVELAKSTLTAPFDATVIRRHLDEGAVVKAGVPVLRLQEQAGRRARVGVAGPVTAGIAPGQTRRLRVDGRTVNATVHAVLPLRGAATRTVDVILDLPPDGIRPGELVTLAVDRRVDARGYWLPMSAVSEGQRGLWTAYAAVPAVDAEGFVVTPKQLTVLHETAERVFVQGALDGGTRVIASGRHRVVPGQRVTLADGLDDAVARRGAVSE